MALYRHTIKGVAPGESWTFTMHSEGTLSAGDANAAMIDAVSAAWTNGMASLTPAEIALSLVSTATIDPSTDKQLTRVEGALSTAGSALGQMMPFQCATVVSLRTNLATRSGRGRFYLPPLSVEFLLDGKITGAALGTLDTAWTAFFSSLNTANLTVVVRNRTLHVSTTVTSARVGDVIDTQRRRRNKLIETFVDVAVP